MIRFPHKKRGSNNVCLNSRILFARARAELGRRRKLATACFVATMFATACSVAPPLSAPPPPPQCSPSAAPEILSITAHNVAATDLHDYPVAIAFDKTNFDFNLPSQYGSNITTWNTHTCQAIHSG